MEPDSLEVYGKRSGQRSQVAAMEIPAGCVEGDKNVIGSDAVLVSREAMESASLEVFKALVRRPLVKPVQP